MILGFSSLFFSQSKATSALMIAYLVQTTIEHRSTGARVASFFSSSSFSSSSHWATLFTALLFFFFSASWALLLLNSVLDAPVARLLLQHVDYHLLQLPHIIFNLQPPSLSPKSKSGSVSLYSSPLLFKVCHHHHHSFELPAAAAHSFTVNITVKTADPLFSRRLIFLNRSRTLFCSLFLLALPLSLSDSIRCTQKISSLFESVAFAFECHRYCPLHFDFRFCPCKLAGNPYGCKFFSFLFSLLLCGSNWFCLLPTLP